MRFLFWERLFLKLFLWEIEQKAGYLTLKFFQDPFWFWLCIRLHIWRSYLPLSWQGLHFIMAGIHIAQFFIFHDRSQRFAFKGSSSFFLWVPKTNIPTCADSVFLKTMETGVSYEGPYSDRIMPFIVLSQTLTHWTFCLTQTRVGKSAILSYPVCSNTLTQHGNICMSALLIRQMFSCPVCPPTHTLDLLSVCNTKLNKSLNVIL